MNRVVVIAGLCAFLGAGVWCEAQQPLVQQLSHPASSNDGRRFFPRDFVRGYVDFEMAPPHNEIDLGLCVVTTANPLSQSPACSAFARFAWSGYLEIQPFGRGPWRRAFLFVEPKVYGGNNLPQQNYTASGSLILWEHTVGVGLELPKGFELRVKSHGVNLLGRYAEAGGAKSLRTDGPYGLYTTVGVRWNFGGWGGASERRQ